MYVLLHFSIYPLKLFGFFFFGQALCRCIQYTQFTSPLCVCVCLPVCHLLRKKVGKKGYDIAGV